MTIKNRIKALSWMLVLTFVALPLFVALFIIYELILHKGPPLWWTDFVGHCVMKIDEAHGKFLS